MEERMLAAPCGLYCGACPILRATSDRSLAEKLAPQLGMEVEAVHCRGCRAEEGKMMGWPLCQNYECITQRGLEFCYECPDFPCLKLAPCADRADVLPHNQKVYNLVLMQKMGLENWIKEAPNILRRYFKGKKDHGGSELKL